MLRATPGVLTALLLAILPLTLTGCDDLIAAGWGSNHVGQLGDLPDARVDQPAPLDGSALFSRKTIAQISAAEQSSCALATDGAAACWGSSTVAGETVTSPTPVPVEDLRLFRDRTITHVEAGAGLKCALTSDGAVGCWDNTGERTIDGVLNGEVVIQLSVGDGHACALTASGLMACWGDNSRGQLGDDSTTTRLDPVVVSGNGDLAGRRTVQISAGRSHTCATTADGVVACWGDNSLGQLGDGTTTTRCRPTTVAQVAALAATAITSVSSGSSHTCAVTEDGRAVCWGFNLAGQLGDGTILTTSSTAVEVNRSGVLGDHRVIDVSAGDNHSCALLADRSAACWGSNNSGQLGDGSTSESAVPVAVGPLVWPDSSDPIDAAMTDLDVGGAHSLAVFEAAPGSRFVPMDPVRVLDTRIDEPTALNASQYLAVGLSGVIPEAATAIAFNVTATGQTASGFLEVAPEGADPGSSTINWSAPQQTIANGYITKISAENALRVTLESMGTAHAILDITGYFVAPESSMSGALFTGADRRIYDSRGVDGPLAPGESRELAINPAPELPFDVAPTAAAINVTVTGTTGSGVLTAARSATQATSTINWSAGAQTVANAVITPVSTSGTFTITNNGTTPAEVVVDLTGTFAPESEGASGAAFFAVDPARVYDSRVTNGLLGAGETRVTTNPVPADAVAVAANSTVTGTSGTGFLTVSPPSAAGTVPTTSTVNWFTSPTTRANGSIIPIEATVIGAYTGGNYSTEYVLDIAGFFR